MQISYGETLLREYVSVMLPMFETIYNHRPLWLERLEIDIYFPKLKAGLEFQGDQHYCLTEFAGNPQPQQRRDKHKLQLCKRNNVLLLTLDASDLEYRRLRARLKRIFSRRPDKKGVPKPSGGLGNENIDILRKLNHEAIAYRKGLIASFDSPTAHRKKSAVRQKAIDRHNNLI